MPADMSSPMSLAFGNFGWSHVGGNGMKRAGAYLQACFPQVLCSDAGEEQLVAASMGQLVVWSPIVFGTEDHRAEAGTPASTLRGSTRP